ncbi:Cd2+/Zn2+-exporting ATPase [Aneurinibacillus soli]|uniref:Cd(2+)-exporting ATPase n=1 Tax=Aneurinibacillus soli TaxID=1500254 RepID=A0A0U4NIC5_9BACL|nr:heavy metal translocating P-type ATPase [Aneurinibacillus soli]PYE61642.1 Cd2+/Zn2+-exporting ATPase [Aneurinibacillus soli]BAU28500.1 putative cadmium-transporting ATPase [Aneurinibacillus soli]
MPNETKATCCTDDACCSPKEVTFKKTLSLTPVNPAVPASTASCCTDNGCTAEIKEREEEKGASILENGKHLEYRIEGMDCGACAVTLEKHMRSLPYVTDIRVNFSTGNMKIVHNTTPETIISEVKKAGYTAIPASSQRKAAKAPSSYSGISLMAVSGILLVLGSLSSLVQVPSTIVTTLYAASILVGGYKPARSAYYAVKSGSLDMNVLMASAAIGAALIGEWLEGATVVFLFALGTTLQTKSIERTRESIRSLMDLAPPEAWVKQGIALTRKPVEEVKIGDTIVVKPGEKIPLDGEIAAGTSSVNQAPITGESIPVDKQEGDPVYAGTVNEEGSLEIHVTKLVEDTTIARIIHLVEEAQEKKAPTEAFVDRFAKIYTPIVFILAILIMIFPPLFGWGTWEAWLYKGLELLVVACPCALVISTPVAIVSAIGNAARHGVLIKGGAFLEIAGTLQTLAFDKTGTLTEGKPKVVKVLTINGTEQDMLAIARTIEEHSKHPIAVAIMDYTSGQHLSSRQGENFTTIVGKGAQAIIDGISYYAGNLKLFQGLHAPTTSIEKQVLELQNQGNTIVIIGTHDTILGIIAVADAIRKTTTDALQKLKKIGIHQTVMLTGDNEGTASHIASTAGVDRYFAELLPEDKVAAIKKLQENNHVVAMVGDGINDAPALATANLGIAMGGAGTDTAMETADIILMADNLEKLPHTITLSRKALRIIKQNIWFSLIVKFIALGLIFPGWLTLWLAVISDTGAALIVIANSMRLLRIKN